VMSDLSTTLCLFVAEDQQAWADAFRRAIPGLDIRLWPDRPDAGTSYVVAAWTPPDGFFAVLDRAQAVFVLGAGIDRFLQRTDQPAPEVPVIRLADAGMAAQMAEFALAGVLRFQRNLDHYEAQQAACRWRPLPARAAGETRVAVLGLGRIGGHVAATLAGLGYKVSGWSRSQAAIAGVHCLAGRKVLPALLGETDILVNILPSTPDTRGLLGRDMLSRLPKGAAIINGGRGDQLDCEALRDLLDEGHLRGACLDVFPDEPLPVDHPLWRHPAVRITPHVAAITLIEPAVAQIAASLRRLGRGEPVEGRVDRSRGY